MKRHPITALVALAAASGLAAAFATAAPAMAAEHHGSSYQQHADRWQGPREVRADRDNWRNDRDDRDDRGWNGGDGYRPAPAYIPTYPAYYPAYGYVPAGGYLNVNTPGLSFGVGF